MSRREQRDPKKERFWRRMVRRWRSSGLTARDFAREQGLSEHSFYGWLRTLRLRDQEAVTLLPVHVRADQPDQVAPDTAAASAPTCAPAPALDRHECDSSSASQLELLLPSGQRLRIGPSFDAAALQRLLAVLAEAPSC